MFSFISLFCCSFDKKKLVRFVCWFYGIFVKVVCSAKNLEFRQMNYFKNHQGY